MIATLLDAALALLVLGLAAWSILARDAFALIDAAEIEFSAKEAAWRAASSLGGLGLVQELAGVDIPTPLRDALVEVAAAREVW